MASMIWAVILAAGIPSAVFGLLLSRLQRRIERIDRAREEKENARLEHEVMTIELIMAAITLSEATAEAVQRIPDAHCNGDMSAALEFAKAAKQKYRDFERKQTVKALA